MDLYFYLLLGLGGTYILYILFRLTNNRKFLRSTVLHYFLGIVLLIATPLVLYLLKR